MFLLSCSSEDFLFLLEAVFQNSGGWFFLSCLFVKLGMGEQRFPPKLSRTHLCKSWWIFRFFSVFQLRNQNPKRTQVAQRCPVLKDVPKSISKPTFKPCPHSAAPATATKTFLKEPHRAGDDAGEHQTCPWPVCSKDLEWKIKLQKRDLQLAQHPEMSRGIMEVFLQGLQLQHFPLLYEISS